MMEILILINIIIYSIVIIFTIVLITLLVISALQDKKERLEREKTHENNIDKTTWTFGTIQEET